MQRHVRFAFSASVEDAPRDDDVQEKTVLRRTGNVLRGLRADPAFVASLYLGVCTGWCDGGCMPEGTDGRLGVADVAEGEVSGCVLV
jgi:hypothetical protein